MGNVIREYHAPCTLKTSFEDFEKEKVNCNRYTRLNIVSPPNRTFHWQLQVDPVDPSLHLFLYIIELALVLNTADYLQNIFVHNCIGHFSMQ